MFSEIQYNKIQIYVIKIFEMTHPLPECVAFRNVAYELKLNRNLYSL